MIRVGQSIDIHPLKSGLRLVLGGVEVDAQKGLVGHSDADALLHAIGESILGALALGDLGTHFPDTDPAWKNKSSLLILEAIYQKMHDANYRIGNVDATILAEQPKLAPYIDQMRSNVAKTLHCDLNQISIKATRGENLGFVGQEEGIVALAVCLLESVE